MLKYSYYVYGDKEWYKLPKWLYELGAFEKGDEALEEIEKYRPKSPNNPLQRGNLYNMVEANRQTYGNDLIEIQASYTRCEKCAIYAGRIYSVNGEDDRFPKCPDWIIEKGGICDNGCGSAIFPLIFVEDSTVIYEYVDKGGCVDRVGRNAIFYSNRPFVDMRNDAEIERYYKLQSQREDELIKSKYYMLNYKNFCSGKIKDPKKSPKTFSAYMRKLNKEGRYY